MLIKKKHVLRISDIEDIGYSGGRALYKNISGYPGGGGQLD